MQCEEIQMQLDELIRNELPPDDAAAVEAHLGGCPVCARLHQDLVLITRHREQLRSPVPVSFKSTVMDHYARLDLDGSSFWMAWSPRGVRRISGGGESERVFVDAYETGYRRPLEPGRPPEAFQEPVVRAFRGDGAGRPPGDLPPVADFAKRVLETLLSIPAGEVRSYAWVAREAGRPRAVRAVGNACARNPVPFLLPCHRVVPTGGGLGRYALGPELKRSLLSREGLDVGVLERLGDRGVRYIGSREGGFYCFPTCLAARRIPAGDRILLSSDQEALVQGLAPCSRCRPLGYAA